MKQLLLIILFLPCVTWSQEFPRELLSGQVIADSIGIADITVENTSSKIIAKTNYAGKFTLYVKEKDTLLFYAAAFSPVVFIVNADDLERKIVYVRIKKNAIALDEVVISRVGLSGDLDADSKKIKTISMGFDSGALYDRDYGRGTELVNTTMPTNESSLQGINFIRIGESILGWFVKPKPKKIKEELPVEIFSDVAQQKFSYYFFTKTLGIAHADIGLFLHFCDLPEARKLLHPDKELELTDYLIKKSAEFLKNKEH